MDIASAVLNTPPRLSKYLNDDNVELYDINEEGANEVPSGESMEDLIWMKLYSDIQ